MQNINIKLLKNLPKRDWGKTTVYNSLIIIKTGTKHDSGYANMTIVGCDNNHQPKEITAICDSIEWNLNNLNFRTDMFYPSGAIHFFGKCKFEVGVSLSSTCIKLLQI